MPWTVSADTKGFKFTRWDQNTLEMGINTEKPCFTASTDLQGLPRELRVPHLSCADSALAPALTSCPAPGEQGTREN